MVATHANDLVYDAACNEVKNNAIRIHACAWGADPYTYANIAGNELGQATISATDFTGPQDRSPSGREIVFDGKAISITVSGTVDSLVFSDNSSILYFISLPSANIGVQGGTTTMTINSFTMLGIPDITVV